MFWVPKTIETLAIQRMEGNMVEGFVKGSGNQYPELLLFGEAPGENEVIHGIPLYWACWRRVDAITCVYRTR